MSNNWKVGLAALMLAFAGVACNGGDDGDGDGNGDNGGQDAAMDTEMPDTMTDMGCQVSNTFALSGTARVHPVVQQLSGSTQNLSGVEARIQVALSAVGAQFDTIRQTGTCEDAIFTTASDYMMPSTTFEFPDGVDATNAQFGVVATVDDTGSFDTSASGDWVATVSGIASSNTQGVVENDVSAAQVFGVTTSAEEAFASLIGPENSNVSGDPGSLAAQGPALFWFVDSQGNPVEDVKLYTESNADAITGGGSASAYGDVYYPSADFSSVSVGADGSTSANGTAIALNTSLMTNYTGLQMDGSGNVTMEFTSQQGGNVNGVFYTVTLTEAAGGN